MSPMVVTDELLAALEEFNAAVASLTSGPPVPTDDPLQGAERVPVRPNLQDLFRRIDELTARLPADADSRLRHFLEQKSYQKARNLLAASRPG